MKIRSMIPRYLTGETLSLKFATTLFVFEILLGMAGYMLLEAYSVTEALYMTIITISTVGFGEVKVLSPSGQLFTTVLILLNIGIFAYAASAFTYFIVQGNIFKKLNQQDMDKKINTLNHHVIVAGYGRFGHEIVNQLMAMHVPFVIIEKDADIVERLKEQKEALFIHGDATEDQTLIDAGIKRADAIITAVHDDTSNLYTVLSARQLQPGINIISRAQTVKAENKLKLAGASHVILPKKIGGFYMAALVHNPDAIEFFSFLTNKADADISFEEYHYDQLPPSFRNKSLDQIQFRKKTGVNVIAFRDANGKFVVNPPANLIIEPHTSIIVIGTKEQIRKMLDFCPKIKR